MPLLAGEGAIASSLRGRTIRVPGLPDFNDDYNFIAESFEGYMGATAPEAVLVGNGGGPGAVAVGDWLPAEEYVTLKGRIIAPHPRDVAPLRSLLLQAFPTNRDTALIVVGNDWDIDKQLFVRRYDRLDAEQRNGALTFALPLVAPDPYKYALTGVSGSMGVFAGANWYRTYDTDGTGWYRTYSNGVRLYSKQVADGPFPLSVGLRSPGDATSGRVTVEVVGPLPLGWWVERQDAAGVVAERVWVQTALADGQTLTLETQARSARLDGADVSHLLFGNWLTMPPGPSTFRLVAPESTSGHATVTALPAYQ